MPAPDPHTPVTRASIFLRLNASAPECEIAWQEFYTRYAPIIAGFARRLGSPSDQADDLAHDVLHAFFRASPEFEYDPSKGSFRGYLKSCTCRRLSQLRAKDSRDTHAAHAKALEPNPHLDSAWDDAWETEHLHRALDAVRNRYSTNPERQTTFRAFEMSAILGLPTQHVARELGLSAEGVRAARSRVSRALRQEFDSLVADQS